MRSLDLSGLGFELYYAEARALCQGPAVPAVAAAAAVLQLLSLMSTTTLLWGRGYRWPGATGLQSI